MDLVEMYQSRHRQEMFDVGLVTNWAFGAPERLKTLRPRAERVSHTSGPLAIPKRR